MRIIPRGNRILVQDQGVGKLASGLVLPEGSTGGKLKSFIVLDIGPEVEDIEVGDLVAVTNLPQKAFTIDERNKLFIVDPECILAILRPDED